MKEQGFVKGALILTAASLISRFLGFALRVYISGKIFASGMGLYQLIISVYMVFATFATSGVSVAVSKLCAEEEKKGDRRAAKRVFKRASVFSGLLGLFSGLALFASSDYIGNVILGNKDTVIPLMILASGLPFIAVSSCLQGYFIARRKAILPALSQVIEQILKIAVTALLFITALPKGITFAVISAMCGITVADIGICIFGLIFYGLDRETSDTVSDYRGKNIAKRLVSQAVPLALNSYTNSLLRMTENILIPSRLKLYGFSQEGAMQTYGMLKGMALPLLFFPSSFISSLAATLIPAVSGGDMKYMRKTVSLVMKYTLMLGILFVSIFISFPYEIGFAVYKDAQVGSMLRNLSFICPFVYLEMIAVAVLNGLSQQLTSFKVNLLDCAVRITAIFLLMPIISIKGFYVAITLSSIISIILYLRRLYKVARIRISITEDIIIPSLCAAFCALAVRILYKLFLCRIYSALLSLILCIFLICIMFLSLSVIFKVIKKDELKIVIGRIKTKSKTS